MVGRVCEVLEGEGERVDERGEEEIREYIVCFYVFMILKAYFLRDIIFLNLLVA